MRAMAVALVLSILFYGPAAVAEQSSQPFYASPYPSASTQEADTSRLDEIMSMNDREAVFEMQKVPPYNWSLDTSGPLFAQVVPGEPEETTPGDTELVQQIRALQDQKARISTGSSTAAIIGSAVATGVGLVTFLTVTIASCGFNCGSGPTEWTAGIGGGVGVAGLIVLATGLSSRKKKRTKVSEIDQKIDRINRERSAESPRLGARITLGDEKMLVLSLQY